MKKYTKEEYLLVKKANTAKRKHTTKQLAALKKGSEKLAKTRK